MKIKRTLFLALFLLAIAPATFAYRVAVWVPPWDAGALTSLQQNVNAIGETNPVWYSWNADGTIAKNWNAENNSWRAAMSPTQMLPTIQNVVKGSYDGAAVEAMLATAAAREAHASAIAQLVAVNAFDGIDIDYERIPTSSRANFTAFISTLAGKLHAAKKKLSVTVYAKTSDSQNWTGPGAADWSALGGLADSIKIMAYDYSWSTSAPGPISPLDWLDKVASYAQSTIPNDKIMIGLPFYGYNWNGGSGRGVSYTEAIQGAANQGVSVSYDANGEATYTYANGAGTVYFQDATSYARKVEMLKQKHPQIGGFAHWSLGQEDPAIWNYVRGGSSSSTSPATPPPTQPPATQPPSTEPRIEPAPTPTPTPTPSPSPALPSGKRRAAGH